MSEAPNKSHICLLLTATVIVKDDLVFTERKDANVRLNDYKQALTMWLAHPEVRTVVFVENSGADLSELRAVAAQHPNKMVEFLSFAMPEFDSRLGKGVGEMACMQHAVEYSTLLRENSRFLKVTGRYFVDNATELLRWVIKRNEADVLCDMLQNLTWADSRAFAATSKFMRAYMFPLSGELDDSAGSNFEHVLARAVHACMADRGVWGEPPIPLRIRGVSGSQNRRWRASWRARLKSRLRHSLFVRALATDPQ